MPADSDTTIVRRIAQAIRNFQIKPADDVGAALNELAASSINFVPGAQYAGITVTSRKRPIETAAAIHRFPVVLDEIQQRHRQGPCLTAASEHHTVRVDNLAGDERWPLYRDDALQQTPIRSILSFELFTDYSTVSVAM
jgi:hypothetical protein